MYAPLDEASLAAEALMLVPWVRADSGLRRIVRECMHDLQSSACAQAMQLTWPKRSPTAFL
eukprot:CAMPEP_0206037554 /NCGR_PEP_ID=MMETSP1466-20131121/3528_1 /ASSEMBLY_ACC=CAM_ASM_001126 /TAXON_ID=44452 /ORGANISM="Pavlova gyrans, Strain CCMP608" /LENGTH=60 /DNA_ID=CAMNT_0053412111 /DNA_START=124 /DNA_END=303 /DNA_ORIENTATION=-